MTDSKSRCVVEISTDTRPIVYLTIDRLSTDYQPTIDRLLTDYRPTVDRLSTYYRPTIDRLSTDYRPLYRPLCRPPCRPQSRSTLPTVNKIHFEIFSLPQVIETICRQFLLLRTDILQKTVDGCPCRSALCYFFFLGTKMSTFKGREKVLCF